MSDTVTSLGSEKFYCFTYDITMLCLTVLAKPQPRAFGISLERNAAIPHCNVAVTGNAKDVYKMLNYCCNVYLVSIYIVI